MKIKGETMNTQFVRSKSDRMIGGVCGGIARYFNIDPVIVRLVFVLSVFLGGVSPLIYVLLWIVMPEEATASSAPQQAYATRQALPDHPRPVEQWKFDPYTGEKIS
jgi:phage shock protein C